MLRLYRALVALCNPKVLEEQLYSQLSQKQTPLGLAQSVPSYRDVHLIEG